MLPIMYIAFNRGFLPEQSAEGATSSEIKKCKDRFAPITSLPSVLQQTDGSLWTEHGRWSSKIISTSDLDVIRWRVLPMWIPSKASKQSPWISSASLALCLSTHCAPPRISGQPSRDSMGSQIISHMFISAGWQTSRFLACARPVHYYSYTRCQDRFPIALAPGAAIYGFGKWWFWSSVDVWASSSGDDICSCAGWMQYEWG